MKKNLFSILSLFIFLVVCYPCYPGSITIGEGGFGLHYRDTSIRVTTNLESGVYKRDEPILFDISAKDDEKDLNGEVAYTISIDGKTTLQKGTLNLTDGHARIYWQTSLPSIIRCKVNFVSKSKDSDINSMAAAAVDPNLILPTAHLPEDFTAYWEGEKARLSLIPINPELRPVKRDQPDIFDLTLDNISGSKVHGYFGKPLGNGPFPAILMIPGAGVGNANYNWVKNMVAKGFMAMAITVHELPNGQPDEFYKEKAATSLTKYFLKGRENKDSFYFHRVILGAIRAVDFLTGQQYWDKRHMIVYGSSQGGGLTLITTGLDSRVTAAVANVPALCDHSGRDFGRPSGWPQMAPELPDGRLNPEILKVSEYYDAVNFSRFIRVPVLVGVGLIDNTCHPTTVFSAFNVINSTKQIDIAPLMGHDFSPSFDEMREKFFIEQSRN